MKVSKIKDLCLNASKAYYKYLSDKPDGGVDEVDITAIDRISDDTFKLKITRKLFDPDLVSFRYGKKDFASDSVKIKAYDENNRIIIVKVNKPTLSLFVPENVKEWKLIIDLKFLVQRVINWYEQNGDRLIFNPGTSINNIEFDDGVFLPQNTPSLEQKKAINTIFNNNFCYIWGAPGTGKTRFVLSYAILTYINNNKRVLILAPTNVALEQIFRGVMEIIDAAGVDRRKLLRLGVPSKSFAVDFSEICEIQGIEKELKRLNEKIRIISSILGVDTEEQKKIKILIECLKSHESLLSKQQRLVKISESITNKIKSIENQIVDWKYELKTIHQEKEFLIRKKNSLVIKLFEFLSNKVDYNKEIEQIIEKEKVLDLQIDIGQRKGLRLQKRFEKLQDTNKNHLGEINSNESFIRDNYSSENINFSQLDEKIVELEESCLLKQDDAQVIESLANEYRSYSEQDLRKMLCSFEEEKKKLVGYSLDERIQNVNVVGATLDTYLHRFNKKTVGVDHIFIDEAGYASVVKALTVFTVNVPITLLGDHKQLPPVCELSKLVIKNNAKYQDIFVWDQSAIYLEEVWTFEEKEDVLENYMKASSPIFNKLVKSSLTETYRFGPNLAEALKNYVYQEDGFRSNVKEDTDVIVFKVKNSPKLRVGKRVNESEAKCIESYIKEHHDQDSEFAILTPYRDQVKRLKQLLPNIKDDERILTVHKSQGREWDTVVYSVCDYGNGKKPWFTDTTSSISNGLSNVNTAISRAKKRLVIVCSYSDWEDKDKQLICGLLKSATKVVSYNINE